MGSEPNERERTLASSASLEVAAVTGQPAQADVIARLLHAYGQEREDQGRKDGWREGLAEAGLRAGAGFGEGGPEQALCIQASQEGPPDDRG